jgi:hypothetical protein
MQASEEDHLILTIARRNNMEPQTKTALVLKVESFIEPEDLYVEFNSEKEALELAFKKEGVIAFQTGTKTDSEKAKFGPWNLIGTVYTADEYREYRAIKDDLKGKLAYGIDESERLFGANYLYVVKCGGDTCIPLTKDDKIKVYNKKGELILDSTASVQQNHKGPKPEVK